jgi:predicted nuclease of predicted toxin-antitoxin system
MKILLDECVTKHLKPKLAPHEVVTVREMGWSGIKNGKLMSLCAENNFEILLTIDKNLQYQQNLDKYSIAIVIFDSNSSDISDLESFIPKFLTQIESFEKHKAHLLPK